MQAPGKTTALATKGASKDSVCAVLRSGRGGERHPFGLEVATVCGAWVHASAIDHVSLTNDRAAVTCTKCRTILDQDDGFQRDAGRMCGSCDRYPSEGHTAACVFVAVFGLTTAPVAE